MASYLVRSKQVWRNRKVLSSLPYVSRERKNENLLHVATILLHRGIPCRRVVATIRAAFRHIFLLAARVLRTEGLG